MAKSLVIAEEAKIATLMDKGKAIEFFFQNDGFSIGDIYTARVENILPSIDAVFVSLGTEKMGFLHASDIPGHGNLSERIWPKQKLLVQVVKEPTSNKGPRVSTDITLIGRFFVLTTENDNIILSRHIASVQERARLKSIATLLKPPVGFGLVVRTEAMGATEKELEEDFRELFLERWKYIIDQFESQRRPSLIIADSRDLLYRVLRDVFHDGVDTVAVDNEKAAQRAQHYLELWSHKPPEVDLLPTKKLLKQYGVLDELKLALSSRIELPSGGYVHIQPTEALTVIDVNSGKFTSSRTPAETVLKTNLEAATEVSRQLRLRNIGGVIVIDFIDMETKFDRLTVLEHFEKLLETDPAHPQIGRLSDLGLVELTRHRQEKSLFEALGEQCSHCSGSGWIFPIFSLFEDIQENTSQKEDYLALHHAYNLENPDTEQDLEHSIKQDTNKPQINNINSARQPWAERRKSMPHYPSQQREHNNRQSRPPFGRKERPISKFATSRDLEDELLKPSLEYAIQNEDENLENNLINNIERSSNSIISSETDIQPEIDFIEVSERIIPFEDKAQEVHNIIIPQFSPEKREDKINEGSQESEIKEESKIKGNNEETEKIEKIESAEIIEPEIKFQLPPMKTIEVLPGIYSFDEE